MRMNTLLKMMPVKTSINFIIPSKHLYYMKYFFVIILLSAFLIMGLNPQPLKAQENILERKIHLEVDEEPLYKAFNQINRITNYKFSYNSDLLDEDKLVSFSFKDITIRDILDSLFHDPALVYDRVGQHIIIHKNTGKSEKVNPTSEKKSGVSNNKPLYKQMEVVKKDTNYTYKQEGDSSEWTLYNREIKLYKKKQLLAATLNERWNAQTNTWENYDRAIKSYDEQDNLIENIHQQWDPKQNKWVNLKLKTLTYDRYGNKSEVLYHEWQQAAGQWFSTVRYLVDYNLMGEKKEMLIKVYSPATETWSNDTRYTFKYNDGLGPPDETLVESWNSFTESWDDRGKYYMHYNLRGNKVKETLSTWNETMSQWINGLRYLRDYNNKRLTSEIEQRWDYRDNEWNNAIRSIFSYDEQGQVKQTVQDRWNRDASRWETKNIFFHSNLKNIQKEIPAGKKKDTAK